MTICETKTIYK